jgi:hypothetical protein
MDMKIQFAGNFKAVSSREWSLAAKMEKLSKKKTFHLLGMFSPKSF